jgi:hypothetical protein
MHQLSQDARPATLPAAWRSNAWPMIIHFISLLSACFACIAFLHLR